MGNKLYYRTLNIVYNEPSVNSGIELCTLNYENWYFIGIDHEGNKTLGKSYLNVNFYFNIFRLLLIMVFKKHIK